MSVRVSAAVWKANLPPKEQHLLLALSDWADHEGGNVYPSVASIAAKVGYCERTVRTRLRWLEAHGFIVADRRGGGRSCTTRYRIVLAALKTGRELPGLVAGKPGKIERKPGNSAPKTRQPVAEDPSVIREIDPSSGGPEPDGSTPTDARTGDGVESIRSIIAGLEARGAQRRGTLPADRRRAHG